MSSPSAVPVTELLYEGMLALSRPAFAAAGLVSARVRRAVSGRRQSLRRLQAWGAAHRDASRPLVWVHAPSVGEGLMAQAIIAELRAVRPDLQVAFTHFSPSAERMVAEVGADVWGYLPWDTRGPVRRALAALAPSAVVFVRTEVWPVLARQAAASGARLLLVNAVLAEDSSRLTGPGRRFLRHMYRRLDAVGAVSPSHGERYGRLGVPADRIRVTGDARFDQVWARAAVRGLAGQRGTAGAADRAPDGLRPIWRLLDDPAAVTVVAGSTWPQDEKVLLPAVASLGRDHRVRLVVAPHEPTAEHLSALEARLDGLALRHGRLGALVAAGSDGAGAPEVVVVDRMGVLADLYALGDAAYVGGGFGTAGLHSVVEPAALGVPVLFGPAHGNAREAAELAAAGGGFVVGGAGEVESCLRRLAGDPAAARAAGAAARDYVRAGTGAAARNAALVADHLGGPLP